MKEKGLLINLDKTEYFVVAQELSPLETMVRQFSAKIDDITDTCVAKLEVLASEYRLIEKADTMRRESIARQQSALSGLPGYERQGQAAGLQGMRTLGGYMTAGGQAAHGSNYFK